MEKYQTKVNEKFAAYDFADMNEDESTNASSAASKKIPQFELGAFLSQFPVYKGI